MSELDRHAWILSSGFLPFAVGLNITLKQWRIINHCQNKISSHKYEKLSKQGCEQQIIALTYAEITWHISGRLLGPSKNKKHIYPLGILL